MLDHVDARPTADDHSSLFLSDLTDATLAGSRWADDEEGERPWQWATLCRTMLPADAVIDGDRDCPRPPTAQADGFRGGSRSESIATG